jgi:type IV secretion system protein VirD4
MPRLSKLIEKLEDRLENKCGSWYARHKAKLPIYIPLALVGWYFYGMFLNSLRLGTAATFHTADTPVTSIWVLNPFKNWLCVFTPFGLGATAVIVLLICLITKKGYIWFSGYKYTKDPRGFNILPDGTHGSSGFLTEKEMRDFLELGSVDEVKGMMLGKYKRRPDDPDQYALYAAHRMKAGDNNNLLCIGAPGSGKSRGFIIPFLMGCAQRGESVFVTDPKGELFEKLSPYFAEKGHYVKAVNFLDMEHSDGWNCLYGLDTETQLVQTVANTIIENTSGRSSICSWR